MSNRNREVTVTARYLVSAKNVEVLSKYLENMNDPVWVDRRNKAERFSFRGVPTSNIDVLITKNANVLELTKKQGKFNGKMRDRFCFRYMNQDGISGLNTELKEVTVVVHPGYFTWIGIIGENDEVISEFSFRTLRTEVTTVDGIDNIVEWHRSRYYSFLTERDCIGIGDLVLASGFSILGEVNRAVSRELYRVARELGFRKLTTREQTKYNVSGQWHKADELGSKFESLNGVGEFTNKISRVARQVALIDLVDEY